MDTINYGKRTQACHDAYCLLIAILKVTNTALTGNNYAVIMGAWMTRRRDILNDLSNYKLCKVDVEVNNDSIGMI